MTDLEKHETEKVASQLADAIHNFNKLNKEQIDYLDLIYQKLTIDSEIEIPVQFNGKLKATILAPIDSDEETVKSIVHSNENVIANLDGKNIVKEIYVKNKIYNIVIK